MSQFKRSCLRRLARHARRTVCNKPGHGVCKLKPFGHVLTTTVRLPIGFDGMSKVVAASDCPSYEYEGSMTKFGFQFDSAFFHLHC